jgi:serine/threonine-protein kinase PpkA
VQIRPDVAVRLRAPQPYPPARERMSLTDFKIPGFELQRQLGQGGMATVFLATQLSLNRKVAIKVMRRSRGDDAAEKRFLMEGQTLARLPHTNIVGVYDIVQNEEIDYIVMECLEGGVLSERMKTGWLTLSDYIGIVVQVAAALQYAHDNGVIHRDLKPDNILFRDARTPVLTDFGIARLNQSQMTRITETGMAIGTPIYMSPEQATGGEVDGRSDQYSLGVMFYEMLARKPPFEAETAMQIAFAHVHTPPPSLPVDFAFAQPLMDKLLAKKASDRFPDLKTFVRELKETLVGSPVLQRRLQIEPGQNISEQLKAMGFTESQLAMKKPLVQIMTNELPPGALANQLLEGSQLQLEPVEVRRTVHRVEQKKEVPWGLIGIVGAAVAALVAASFVF